MDIMLVAATMLEIAPTLEWLQKNEFRAGSNTVHVTITGIGSMQTTYNMMEAIQAQRPEALIQAGIAGSFSHGYRPGTCCIVQDESTGDLGVEEAGSFRDVFDMGFQEAGQFPFTGRTLHNPDTAALTRFGLPLVKAITVNEVTTAPKRIETLQQKYSAIVESMEGAAFHYVALRQDIPFLQLRAVSNMVGERDKSRWQLKDAISTLNQQLMQLLQEPDLFQKHN
ncbi:MAG: futalosine hydrolase [Pseudobacter sp.]|uniref:futalosine hydrolase n=1 Tax=Pseudobacter sp. TaxID=2045420 RepID=UPI003F8225E0